MRSRIVALSVSLALGAALAIPAASVAHAESAEAVGELPIEACKISTSTQPLFNEGFQRDLPAAEPTGTLTVHALFVEFPDLALGAPGNASVEQERDGIAQSVERLETLSEGRLQVTVVEHPDPVMMPKPIADYPATELSTWSTAAWGTFVVDAVMAAAPTVDFSGSDVVWVFFPWADPLPTRAEADNLVYMPPGGPPVLRAVTLPTVVDPHPENTLVHETGHTFGLPDLYDTSGQLSQSQFVADWDLMGLSNGGEFFSWHRWRLDWIDDSQVECVAPGGGGGREITLGALTRNGSTVAAVIPTSDERVLVIESRRSDRYNQYSASRGLLVFVVSSNIESGSGPVRVAPKDGTEPPVFYADFESAPLQVGERYTDAASDTIITVIESAEWSDTIRIAPASDPPPPPVDPVNPVDPVDPTSPDDPSATPAGGSTAALPPTGTDPTAALVLSLGLLTAGLHAVVILRQRTRSPGHRMTGA